MCIEKDSNRRQRGGSGVEGSGVEGTGVEWRGGEGRGGQGRVPDCLGGLSRVGISSRSTRPWNGQPPSYTNDKDTFRVHRIRFTDGPNHISSSLSVSLYRVTPAFDRANVTLIHYILLTSRHFSSILPVGSPCFAIL